MLDVVSEEKEKLILDMATRIEYLTARMERLDAKVAKQRTKEQELRERIARSISFGEPVKLGIEPFEYRDLYDDARLEEVADVGAGREAVARKELLRHARTPEHLPPLQHQHP